MKKPATPVEPLPNVLIEPIVRAALAEDLGRAGDITTNAIIPASQRARGRIVALRAGRIAGIGAAGLAFTLLDQSIRFEIEAPNGAEVAAGETIAVVEGPARALLTGERVALNFLGQLSGVATATARLVKLCEGTKARVTCTRKTTPGLRAMEKHAVRCGGGFNHRFGLDDAILIKDNHIAAAGSVANAITRARAHHGHMTKIEIEVDSLAQLEEALSLKADTILLDNMPPERLREAVKLTAGRATLEASGNVSEKTIAAIAATGVDYISSGAITHSPKCLDVALDLEDGALT
ncbi:MAG: carboxylating nicotinate-nucleotide diphosphorylase [Alphaproteobacteria bacterium]|nr:carboxylating nicotinate-nucleotide diphosphorylase [Alphaproteobacteria bacterium]